MRFPGPAQMIAIVALAVGAVALASPHAADALTIRGQVSRVVDGDTVKIRARGAVTTVRLVGIDTPEVYGRRECFGPQASARAKRLLKPRTQVRVVTDPTQDTRDRYGRLLGYIYKGSARGLRSVNYFLVLSGHAEAYVYNRSRPPRYARQFQAAGEAERGGHRAGFGSTAGARDKGGPRVDLAGAPVQAAGPGDATRTTRGGCSLLSARCELRRYWEAGTRHRWRSSPAGSGRRREGM